MYHYFDNLAHYPIDDAMEAIAASSAQVLILHENRRTDVQSVSTDDYHIKDGPAMPICSAFYEYGKRYPRESLGTFQRPGVFVTRLVQSFVRIGPWRPVCEDPSRILRAHPGQTGRSSRGKTSVPAGKGRQWRPRSFIDFSPK